MLVQTLNSQPLCPLHLFLGSAPQKNTHANKAQPSYLNLLAMCTQGSCHNTLATSLLDLSKASSSQNLPVAMDILETNKLSSSAEYEDMSCKSKDLKPFREIFDYENRLVQLISTDGTVNYALAYNGKVITVTNHVTGEVHTQEQDEQGRLIREVLPSGLEILLQYNGENLSKVVFPDKSAINYIVESIDKAKIQRIDLEGKVLYEYSVVSYGDSGTEETMIGGIGIQSQLYSESNQTLTTLAPNFKQVDTFNDEGKLISRVTENPSQPNSKNTTLCQTGDLLAYHSRKLDDNNRVVEYDGFSCTYDEKGRLTKKKSDDQVFTCSYDALDRLIGIQINGLQVEYTYDIIGRRLSKTIIGEGSSKKEYYLYQERNEVGVYNENKEPLHLRIIGRCYHPSLPLSVAFESHGKTYAPIYNSNYNIAQLIDKDTQEVTDYKDLDPFGSNLADLKPLNPWIFATNHFDSDVGLFNFRHRQYDPSIKQWISQDTHPNVPENELYTYCNNNPLNYIDPDGRFVIFIPLFLGWKAVLIAVGISAAAAGTGIAVQKAVEKLDNRELAVALTGVAGGLIGAAVNKGATALGADAIERNVDEKLTNDSQNDQYRDAVKEIERKLGIKLRESQKDDLHDHVTGQGYGYHELVEEGYHLFDDSYRNNNLKSIKDTWIISKQILKTSK